MLYLLYVPALRARDGSAPPPPPPPPQQLLGGAPHGTRPRQRLRVAVTVTSHAEAYAVVALRLSPAIRADSAADTVHALRERFRIAVAGGSAARASHRATVPAWSLEEDAILAAAFDLLGA